MDTWQEILKAYAITFGWAMVGTLSVATGTFIALKLFTFATRDIDEWAEIKKNNISMAIVLAALVLSMGIVVASITRSQ